VVVIEFERERERKRKRERERERERKKERESKGTPFECIGLSEREKIKFLYKENSYN